MLCTALPVAAGKCSFTPSRAARVSLPPERVNFSNDSQRFLEAAEADETCIRVAAEEDPPLFTASTRVQTRPRLLTPSATGVAFPSMATVSTERDGARPQQRRCESRIRAQLDILVEDAQQARFKPTRENSRSAGCA